MQFEFSNYSTSSFIPCITSLPEDIEILTITQLNLPNGRCFPKLPSSIKTIKLECNIRVDNIKRIRADWTTSQLRDFLKCVFGENKHLAIELGDNILTYEDYKGIDDEIYHKDDNIIYKVFKGVANLDDIDLLYNF